MKIRGTPAAERRDRLGAVASGHGGADQGWTVISTLLGGFAVWGVIGWLLDRWWGTHIALPIGLIVGMALGIYAVVARATHAPPAETRPTDPQPGPPPASFRRENE